jgi:ATP-binding cassette subfamily B protein
VERGVTSRAEPRIRDLVLLARLIRYVRPYRWLALAGLLSVLAASGLVIAGPILVGKLIDDGILAEAPDVVAAIAFLYLGVQALRFAGEYGQIYLLQRLGQLTMRDLRMEVFEKLQKLPMAYYEKNPVGRIVTRSTNDVHSLQELFSVGLLHMFKDVVLVLGIAAALLWLDPVFGAVTLAAAPLVAVTVGVFRHLLRKAFRRVRAAVARVNGTVQENVNGAHVAQLFGIEEERHRRFRQDNDELRAAMTGSVRAHAMFVPMVSMASTTAMALVFWYGGGAAIQGAISLGVLVTFVEFMPHLINPIRDFGEKFTILQSAYAAAERVFGLMDEPPGIVDRPGLAPLPKPRGEVSFEGVRFGYEPGREILRGIDLRVRAGERVALVGRTGSGKTTIARLLARFYDPWAGAVRLDGRDLREVPLEDLRRGVAVVNQELFVFAASILENVRMGSGDVSRERAIEACRWTNAHTFAERRPEGYDRLLAEGGRDLSVGERQLLAFARALAREPAVLILDEATANVDTRTEQLIVEALDRITRGRTSIVIAHRLATVRRADRVVVIDDGRIVEEGAPERLLESRGTFRRLHELQFQA